MQTPRHIFQKVRRTAVQPRQDAKLLKKSKKKFTVSSWHTCKYMLWFWRTVLKNGYVTLDDWLAFKRFDEENTRKTSVLRRRILFSVCNWAITRGISFSSIIKLTEFLGSLGDKNGLGPIFKEVKAWISAQRIFDNYAFTLFFHQKSVGWCDRA